MALGGVDTGCFDLETSGMLGYNTIFNTLVPRRCSDNQRLLGLSIARLGVEARLVLPKGII
jgi:hypothetical protein